MSTANRRYAFRAAVALIAYVAATVAVHTMVQSNPPEGGMKWALALAPAVPVLGLFGAVALYLVEETDEFARMVIARALIGAAGVSLVAATVWDSLVAYGDAPPMRPFLIVTLFFVAFGLIQPLVRLGYR
ncbi:MAG: hypothetical protein JSR45_13900 [Proteobacteria bacterium]|nr:hypothetical protein [Pseudomonadota bacterium]